MWRGAVNEVRGSGRRCVCLCVYVGITAPACLVLVVFHRNVKGQPESVRDTSSRIQQASW